MSVYNCETHSVVEYVEGYAKDEYGGFYVVVDAVLAFFREVDFEYPQCEEYCGCDGPCDEVVVPYPCA